MEFLIPLWFIITVELFLVGSYFLCEKNDSPGVFTGFTLAFIVFLYFITNPSGAIYTHLLHHIFDILVYVPGYFIIGAFYSVIKWWRYLKSATVDFKLNHSPSDSGYAIYLERFLYKANARHHKGLLFMWILYWPLSLIWLVINDPITKLVTALVNSLSSIYSKIGNYVTRDLQLDMDTYYNDAKSKDKL